MDCSPDAHVGAAAADVSIHRGIDFRVAWIVVLIQQSDRRHDLARLTIATLSDIQLFPRLLYGSGSGAGHPLNGRDNSSRRN